MFITIVMESELMERAPAFLMGDHRTDIEDLEGLIHWMKDNAWPDIGGTPICAQVEQAKLTCQIHGGGQKAPEGTSSLQASRSFQSSTKLRSSKPRTYLVTTLSESS